MSRSPGIDEEKTMKICLYLSVGAPAKYACKAAGVPVRTYNYWLKKGREGVEPYATFLDRIEQAAAEVVCDLSKRIREADCWRASAWLLERLADDEFGKTQKLEHSGTTTQVQVQGKALGKDVTRQIRARVLGLTEDELEDKERLGKDWGLG